MHRVENTQYCTVHGGKNPEERRVSDGSAPPEPRSEGNQEVSAAEHGERKASGTRSTYFRGRGGGGRGAGGAIYYHEQETGGLSVKLMCKQLQQESTAGPL